MAVKIYEVIPYDVVGLKWERTNWNEVVEFLKTHNTEIINISKYHVRTIDYLKNLCGTAWFAENIDDEGRYGFTLYRPSSECSDEYEEFVEMGDYLVIGKDGLIYVKKSYSFENMFREKENV